MTMIVHEVKIFGIKVARTIHLPGAAEGRHPGKGGGWVIPYCVRAPLLDVQECCTQMSFWLCPCCCWAHCLWLCHIGDRRERSHLPSIKTKSSPRVSLCLHHMNTAFSAVQNYRYSMLCLTLGSNVVLTCPHNKYHYYDYEFSCSELGGLAHFFHGYFVWNSKMC